MNLDERKEAIKEIEKIKKLEYKSGVKSHHYTAKEVVMAILVGGSLASYIVQKGVEPIANLEALPSNGYLEESWIWIKQVFLPKLRSFPELWNAIKPNNSLEGFTAATTALFAGAGMWFHHKKALLKKQLDKEQSEEIKGLGR